LTRRLTPLIRDLRIRGSRGVRRPSAGRWEGEEDAWLLLALGLATMIAVIDGIAGDTAVLIGVLALPPILASATAGSRATILVAGYCLALVLMSTLWHDWNAVRFTTRVFIVTSAGGLSIWNARLREQMLASARGGAMLAEGMAMLDKTLEEQAMAEELARLPVPDLAGLAVVELVADDDTIGAVAVEAADPEMAKRIKRSRRTRRLGVDDDHPTAEVVRTGERRLWENVTDAAMREIALDSRHLDLIRDVRPRSVLIVPLATRGKVIGTLLLASLVSDNRFGKEEIAFAEELARRAAAGILNARLHDAQAQMAEALQQALLPRALPEVPGLEIDARFRPVGMGTEVGGDFYNVFRIEEKSWVAAIGDVCGKGPEAAALTSLMRDTLRVSALRGDAPADALGVLNAAILEASTEGRFCTASYVRLDLGPRTRITVCNGGHPPPLLMHKDGKVEPVGKSGTLLGIYEDPALEDTEARLARGDVLMLYTDGLYDVRPSSKTNPRPVEQVLASCRGKSAEEVAATIEKNVIDTEHGSQQDDQALLVLRRV
jgi:serine phosphatase RsbU (regulator of sigma subunit)